MGRRSRRTSCGYGFLDKVTGPAEILRIWCFALTAEPAEVLRTEGFAGVAGPADVFLVVGKEVVLGERIGECRGDVAGERLGTRFIVLRGEERGTYKTLDLIWKAEKRPPKWV